MSNVDEIRKLINLLENISVKENILLEDLDVDKVKNTRKSYNGFAAWSDAKERSAQAVRSNPEFFDDAYLDKIEMVKEIVEDFFNVHKKIYVTYRAGGNGRSPMGSVKVQEPQWPYRKDKAAFVKELKRLNVEFVQTSTGYIFNVSK
jgi:hypothetical protein